MAAVARRSEPSWSTNGFPDNGFASNRRGMRGSVLADCIEVKDGPFREYLVDELTKRADYRCASSLEEFRSQRRAVTREGQVRSGERHEKDDRHRVDDPRRWVLGWANERKIAALRAELAELEEERATAVAELARLRRAAGCAAGKAGRPRSPRGIPLLGRPRCRRGRVARERP